MRLRGPLLAAGFLLAGAAPASAATFTVTGTADGAGTCTAGACPTLRSALVAALENGAATADTITVPAGNYVLSQQAGGQLNLNSNVTITGASAATTTIGGDGKNFRILAVTGAGRQATVSHVRITFGSVLSTQIPVADRVGGDILVDSGATLTLDHARVDGGQALRGAGIAIRGGTAQITKSLIDTNAASFLASSGQTADAGGILNLGQTAPATLTLTDSTVALNSSTIAAGIESTGNASNAVTVTRSTIAFNSGGANSGNGLNRSAGTFTVSGSIVATNDGDTANDNCSAGITSGGGNAESASTCGFTLASDRQNVQNGQNELVSGTLTPAGETQVLTIPATSVAVGLAGDCTGADQRDLPRPQGAGCDAGAYEVDQPPDTRIDSGPTGLTNGSPTFTFSSPEPGTGFECRLDGPGAATGAFVACTSPKTYSGLTDGAYTLRVRAKDPTFTDATPAVQGFSVDATPPDATITGGPSGTTTTGSPSFTFSSSDASTTFACRLDGPGAAIGTFGPCASPKSFAGLAPGAYSFLVRATDSVGNQTITTRSFVVSVVQQGPPPVSPVYHKTVVAQVVSGRIRVRLKGTTRFVDLDPTKGIPLGSEVDAKAGRLRLFSQPRPGAAAQSAIFFDGIFVVTQPGAITQLALSETLASCRTSGKASAAAAKKKPKTRKLWGDGSGSFRTRGQYSAATVRGTRWLVQDSCGKTLTRVAKGVVSVQDFVKHKTVLVRAPHHYTARKKR